MRLKYVVIAVILGTAAYFLYDAFTQPNTNSLKGNFREVAMYRNPNNTGPVQRIFSVTVEDTLWNEMLQYGQMMPYTKHGTTTVYFFKANGPVPTEISPTGPHFDPQFQANCLAKYHKDVMAFETFVRVPFR